MGLPILPRRTPSGPKLFESLLIAQSIHRVPETAMKEGFHLFLCGQALHWLSLEHEGIIRDFFQYCMREDKEPAIDPSSFALRFFLKIGDSCPVDREAAEACRGLDGRHGDHLTVLLMEGDGLGHVDVTDPVAIGHAKG